MTENNHEGGIVLLTPNVTIKPNVYVTSIELHMKDVTRRPLTLELMSWLFD